MNQLFLIGYRCTGKTSVGKALAEKIGWHFTDADAEVAAFCGMSIADMVSQHGWDYFREQERDAIRRLCVKPRYVIACGGGVVLNPENTRAMKASGFIVWLKASSDTILQRMIADEHTAHQRPSLTSKGLKEEIEETLRVRTPLYESAMNVSVDTDRRSIEEICTEIMANMAKGSLFAQIS